MTGIGSLKDRLRVGAPIVRHNMTILPLFDETAPLVADYLPFGMAQRTGEIRITEVSASGSVPTLSVQTLGDTAVLLLDGEELIGAKQNRIVNLTILVAAKTTVDIPVSCVERGRWSSASPEFFESPQTMYPRGRAKKMMAVSASMLRGTYGADQGEVWEDVDMRMSEMRAASPTSAMGHIFDRHRASLDEYLKDVTWLDGQVGAAFAINGKAVGVEVFESQNIAREYLPKVIRSYALDAMAQSGANDTRSVEAEEVSRLIDNICTAESRHTPSLGIGSDFRIDSPDLTGAALVRDGSVIHLGVFMKRITTDKPVSGGGTPRGPRRPSSGREGGLPTAGPGRIPRTEGPGAETHALEIVRDHMLMRIGNGLALIDTGSPVSIGRGNPLVIQRREWLPSTANAFVLDAVREHLGVAVDWLIGYDILNAHRMLLDWRRGAVHIGRARTRQIASRFPVEMVMGIPVISASHSGTSIHAVVDSGAALSYAPQPAVEGLPEAGEYTDFYPGVGAFTTPTWHATVRLGERDVLLRVGVLPDALQLLFGMLLGPEGWIIGSEFFRDRAVLLDYRWSHILDLTNSV